MRPSSATDTGVRKTSSGDATGSSVKNTALDRRRQRNKGADIASTPHSQEYFSARNPSPLIARHPSPLTVDGLERKSDSFLGGRQVSHESFRGHRSGEDSRGGNLPPLSRETSSSTLSNRRLATDVVPPKKSSSSIETSRSAGQKAAAFLGSQGGRMDLTRSSKSITSSKSMTTAKDFPRPSLAGLTTSQSHHSSATRISHIDDENMSTASSVSRKKQSLVNQSKDDKFLMRRLEHISHRSTGRDSPSVQRDQEYEERSSMSANVRTETPVQTSSKHQREDEQERNAGWSDASSAGQAPTVSIDHLESAARSTETKEISAEELTQKRTVVWRDGSPLEDRSRRTESTPMEEGSGERIMAASGREASKPHHFPVPGERRKPVTRNIFEDDELFEEDDVVIVADESTDKEQDDEKDETSKPEEDIEGDDMPEIKTLEEVEPQVDHVYVDAACFEDRSVVRLQPYHVCNQLVDSSLRKEDGMPDVPCRLSLHAVGWTAPVLCYGDLVQLQVAPLTEVNDAKENDDNRKYMAVLEATNQACILKDQSEHGDLLWQVFRGDSSTHLIRVGTSTSGPSKIARVTAPIHTGDPILLRHVATGGLLTFVSGEWSILTDSYQQEDEPEELEGLLPEGHAIPLNRLRDHNLIIPSLREIFTFILDTVPWTTAWIHGGTLACRKYILKSYLRFPNRHEYQGELASDAAHELSGGEKSFSLRQQEVELMSGQEQLVVEELLGSFLGLEGKYIRSNIFDDNDASLRGQQMQFYLDKTGGGDSGETINFDRGLSEIVEGLLPLSNNFVLLEEFVAKRANRFEYGSVMQALCACLDGMLENYMNSIAAIEDDYRRIGAMSIRELQLICQPFVERLSILSVVAFTAYEKKGGALLNGLRQLLVHRYQGNAVAETVLQELLDAASKPFISMLRNWLGNGVLDDPYDEFMVRCEENASDWWSKYTLHDKNTLQHFFPTPIEVKRVLSTGKYWNAVRACHESMSDSAEAAVGISVPALALEYHANVAQVASYIQKMYASASQSLVNLLMNDCEFLGCMRLLKRYFLLDQGDFFLTFMEAAEEELLRDPARLRQFRVEHLLQVSVQIIEGNVSDDGVPPHNKQSLRLSPADLTCRFAPDSLLDQLDRLHAADGGLNQSLPSTPQRLAYTGQTHPARNCIDLFVLEFSEVPFPLSLILSESSLAKYRLLFRHLFFAKHVEWKLVAVWRDHMAMKEFTSVQGCMGSTNLLRQRMLHCVQNLIYYMNFEVIEPNFNTLMTKLSASSTVKTVDEIMDFHGAFLEQSIEACFLTCRDFVLGFTRVMQTCLLFSKQMETFSRKVRLHQDIHRVGLDSRGRIDHARGAESKLYKEQWMERKKVVQEQTRRVEKEISNSDFQVMITHYERTFDKHLRTFMNTLSKSDDKYHTQKGNLCIRLDYNGFMRSRVSI